MDEHVLCHQVQADMARVHLLADFTNREKVQWLVASINNPAYIQTLLQIESDAAFGARHDFEKACLLLRQHQRLIKSQATRTVYGVNSNNCDGASDDGSDSDGDSLQASYCDSDSAGSNSNDGRARGNGKKRSPPSQNASKRDNTRGGKALDKATRDDGEWNLTGIREGQFDDLARKQTHIDRPHYSPRKFDQLEPLERRKLKLNQQEQVASGDYAPNQDRTPTSSSRAIDSSREVAEIRKESMKMSRMIAQLTRTAGISGGSSTDSGDDESDTEVTNTNNPALCSKNRTNKKARFQG